MTVIRHMTVVASAALLVLPAFGQAQDGGDAAERPREQRGAHARHGDWGDPSRLVERLSHKLDLEAEQSQAIDNILTAARPEIDALRERIGTARAALRDLDVDAPDYGATLQNLSSDLGALTAEAALLHGRVRAEVFAVLSPEQREQASAARHDRFDRSRPQRRHRREQAGH